MAFDPPATWQRFSARERALVVLAALAVVVGALWPLFWQPIERDLERGSAELAALRVQATAARQAADEIAGLARNVRPPRTADLRSAAETVIGARGLRPLVGGIDATDGRVRVTLTAIDVPTLAALLEGFARDEQLFAIEAVLAARVEPGSVRADLTLARADGR